MVLISIIIKSWLAHLSSPVERQILESTDRVCVTPHGNYFAQHTAGRTVGTQEATVG